MLRINEYGSKITEDFIEYCKEDGTYDIAMDHGIEVLEGKIRGVKDYAAWCLMNYYEDAVYIVNEWKTPATPNICWSTNWDDPDNAFTITFDDLLKELDKCLDTQRDDMSIQITFTGDEITQLEKIFGDNIDDKEDLYQTIRMIVETVKTSEDKGGMIACLK